MIPQALRPLRCWLLVWLCMLPVPMKADGKTEPALPPPPPVRLTDGTLVIEARDIPLARILDSLEACCDIAVVGLSDQKQRLVTFRTRGELEEAIKRLLRHLGEVNYAFEYNNVMLTKVSVLPRSQTRAESAPAGPETPREVVNAVKVLEVVEGSQAEALGILPGDLIINYDGTQIHTAQELLKAVKEKSDQETVELIFVREHIAQRMLLKGGFIGVRIYTVKIPQAAMELYYQQ